MTRVALSLQFETLPVGADAIESQRAELGAMSREERLVLVVFVGMAAGWIGGSLLGDAGVAAVPDGINTIVAVAGPLVLFSLPAETADGDRTFVLNWASAVEIPWGVVLLFGGGLAIATGFSETGLAVWIGGRLGGVAGVSTVGILLAVVVLTVALTEVTSNTATTAMLLPILGSVAVGIGVHPYGLMIAAATAASFVFMLPVATPPNAIVFGNGYISLPQMVRVGVGLNLIGIALVTLVAVLWLPVAWGIDITALPAEFLFLDAST